MLVDMAPPEIDVLIIVNMDMDIPSVSPMGYFPLNTQKNPLLYPFTVNNLNKIGNIYAMLT